MGQSPTDIAESDAFIPVPYLKGSLTYCLNGGCSAACVVCDASESCVEGSCQAEYTDNQDGTVTQNTTGLVRLQCALPDMSVQTYWSGSPNAMTSGVDSCPAPQNPEEFMYCSFATNACNAMGTENGDLTDYNDGILNHSFNPGDAQGCERANDNVLGGHTDWRVPTADELQALIPFNTTFFDAPTVPEFGLGYATPLASTMAYWSTNSFDLASAVAVTFDPPVGHSVVTYPQKQKTRLVRCVRDLWQLESAVCAPAINPTRKAVDRVISINDGVPVIHGCRHTDVIW